MSYAKSFTELIVYQKAKGVSKMVFQVSKTFPKEEMYSLTDQLRRAARSVGAQIAEAWAKRRYEKHFVSKLTDADAEQMETQHWLEEALACGYLTPPQAEKLKADLLEIGRMLGAMIEKADAFCNATTNIVQEDTAEYYVAGR
ncbi:MAG: hypothetical protein PCFJNLEI_02542 [Verrucomicrobiae bacterium]|nr:hypothetical protein [Verrucomicrobiae bacterium]